MIETSGEGGSAWLTTPLGGINSSLKKRERGGKFGKVGGKEKVPEIGGKMY